MEKFNDEMLRLKTLLGGKFRGFMIDISPAVAETVEGLNVLLKLYAPKTKIEAVARQNRRKTMMPTKDDSAIGRAWKIHSVNARLLMKGLDWGMGKYTRMPTGAPAATEEERNRFGNWRGGGGGNRRSNNRGSILLSYWTGCARRKQPDTYRPGEGSDQRVARSGRGTQVDQR